jgi:FtsP/CotA-like multicopper oxidase with cupredoxin domain
MNPTIRASPGETIAFDLKNKATSLLDSPYVNQGSATPSFCADREVLASTTNVHFHGFHSPPDCDFGLVASTLVYAGKSYTYKIEVPQNQMPGLYWYQPYIDGLVEQGLYGGASGAVIIEGIEKIVPEVAGLPEQVLIIRDFERTENRPAGYDVDGPQAEVSVNYVPVLYPDYHPAKVSVKPSEKQFWRIVNAAASTTLDLQLVFDGEVQQMKVVSLDGVVMGSESDPEPASSTSILLAPGGRAEIIVETPDEGVDAVLKTLQVDHGSEGGRDPERPLLNVVANKKIKDTAYIMPKADKGKAQKGQEDYGGKKSGKKRSSGDLSKAKISATRSLVISEVSISNSSDIGFYFTVDGDTPAPFSAGLPSGLVVEQGTVEQWVIENRAQDDYTFHMRHVYFAVNDSDEYTDTVTIPSWDGTSAYPIVQLRMDFTRAQKGIYTYRLYVSEEEDAGTIVAVQIATCRKGKCNGKGDKFASFFESLDLDSISGGTMTAEVTSLTVAFCAVIAAVAVAFRRVLAMAHDRSGFAALDTTERAAAI